MSAPTPVGEFELIDAIAEMVAADSPGRGVRIGIGDDAAVVDLDGPAILTTDTLTEGVHFRSGWLSPGDLGRRAVRVAASDIAAMGGRVRYVLLSLGVSAGFGAAHARALAAGVIEETRADGGELVGGNVSDAPGLSLTVTVVGEQIAEPVRRNGARSGDLLLVTGRLGAAAGGVELLERGTRRGALVDAYRLPPRRLDVAAVLASSRLVTSMIDISDGLTQDLAHICRRSGVSAMLDLEAVPVAGALKRSRSLEREPLQYALCGGDDYELLFTVEDSRAARRATRACGTHDCPVAIIGAIIDTDPRAPLLDTSGRPVSPAGYAHGRARVAKS